MLVHGEVDNADEHTTENQKCVLDCHSNCLDEPEDGVVEQVGEWVDGGLLKLAACDRVDNLHENESLEEHTHLNDMTGIET
jgi:hypothetical protein